METKEPKPWDYKRFNRYYDLVETICQADTTQAAHLRARFHQKLMQRSHYGWDVEGYIANSLTLALFQVYASHGTNRRGAWRVFSAKFYWLKKSLNLVMSLGKYPNSQYE